MSFHDVNDTQYEQYIETRQITPSVRRPDSPYVVAIKAIGKEPGGQYERQIEVLLSPDDAIRMAIDLIQKAQSVRDEQAFDVRNPIVKGAE